MRSTVLSSFIGFVLLFTGAAHVHSSSSTRTQRPRMKTAAPGRRFGQSREVSTLRARSGSALQRRALSLPPGNDQRTCGAEPHALPGKL